LGHPDEEVFKDHFYAGLVTGLDLNSRADVLIPNKGVNWITELRAMKALDGNSQWYGKLSSEFSFYLPVFKNPNFIFANRVGGGITVGEPAFFQQMQLGGIQNLRGFHSIRFTGKTLLYNNLEFRIKLFDFTSYLLPGSVGLIAFNDVGRVWIADESSQTWHDGYGGGLYIIPADLVLLQVVIGHSKEGTYPYISLGLRF
jgi:outer membrane protein assembly factor BamA